MRLNDRIRQARKFAKLTQEQLGDAVGVVQSAVVSWEKPGGNEPDLERLGKIATVTGVRKEWLTHGIGEMTTFVAGAKASNIIDLSTKDIHTRTTETLSDSPSKPLQSLPDNLVRLGQKDLPVLGHAKGGEEGFFMDQGRVHGFTARPGILEGVPGAYAVRVHDHSMGNVLRHGFLCWVDPHRPPTQGDEVVIQLADGQAFIKTLVRRTAKYIRCKQYNPEKDIDYPVEGTVLHLIVGSTRIRD